MCTAITRKPFSRKSSRQFATRGKFSLHIQQLIDQKWTSVGCPFASASACACVPPNHSVAPASDGIGVPILIPITFCLVNREPGTDNREPITEDSGTAFRFTVHGSRFTVYGLRVKSLL